MFSIYRNNDEKGNVYGEHIKVNENSVHGTNGWKIWGQKREESKSMYVKNNRCKIYG